MKKITFCLLVFFAVSLSRAGAQTEEEMKAWQLYMTPGEVHKMMAQYAGEWNEEISFWMAPGAEPTKMAATTTSEMILGGRYQLSKTRGDMMGMPFEGMAIMGYDNGKKVITSTWIDNFGTGTMTLEGNWDDQAKSVTLKGKGFDALTGKELNIRQVIKFVDADTMETEMFDNKTGTETKTMAMRSTRKK